MPNSKKCLKAKIFPTFFFTGSLLFTFPISAIADGRSIAQVIQADLQARRTSSFASLVQSWEKKYGSRAFQPLSNLAANKKNPDSDRYIALMSAVKLGGTGAIPMLLEFLRDPSWMIRSGALRALSALKLSKTPETILPLLRDPALVVRVEAVEAVKVLKPQGSAQALLLALEDEKNYHGGKAQWVPQRALNALVELHAKEAAPKLLPLLEKPKHQKDPELLLLTLHTLELLTGKNIKSQGSIPERVKEWKRYFASSESKPRIL